MRKIFVAAIVCLIICAGVKVEAAEIFVGTSPATGFDCYVMTDTIWRTNEHRMVITAVTLKMIDSYGDDYYLDYKFFALDGGDEDVQFTNSDGYKGIVDEYDTPIEWAMYRVTKDY